MACNFKRLHLPSESFRMATSTWSLRSIFFSHNRCYERDTRVYAVKGNEMLVVVNDEELVLLSAFAFSSPLVIQSAQYSGEFPCLLPIHYDAYNVSSTTTYGHGCEELKPHNCTPPPILLDPSKVKKHFLLVYIRIKI